MDIIGYITVYHVFVAHMTGTTVHLGNQLEVGAWPDVARAAVTLASFVVGSVLGRPIIEGGARQHKRTVASITLAGEAALLLAFVGIGSNALLPPGAESMPVATSCLLLGLLAAAMGLQTATLTRIGPLTIHTTFVTGMLNKMAQEIARWLFWVHDSWRTRASFSEFFQHAGKHESFRNAQFMMAIWFSYMMGSVAGTWMNSHWNTAALYVPVFILAASIVVDQIRSLSLEEEKDQG